jgi:hypothetical protein
LDQQTAPAASVWELRTGLKYEQISRAPSTTSTCE